ncbi:MAG: prepilin-type N-terminal cleavage/methylation domain-containing protein [Campylobacterales bacterium]|nr:prepilin-type N-terminal cleavage/methylation domain-containing protein [Campylobacterales bacterium]
MKKNKNAFTMIEMIFVIVILGILAAIAVPKMAATRTDAEITKGRADIASIRSAIITERQGRLIQGQSGWITKLSNTTLFDGNDSTHTLLMYGIAAGTGSGHWQSTNADGLHYTFTIQTTAVPFTYDSSTGMFTCDTANGTTGTMCQTLIN